MLIARCDVHTDRDAVVTVIAGTYPPGYRPLFPGLGGGGAVTRRRDLCTICATVLDDLGLLTIDLGEDAEAGG